MFKVIKGTFHVKGFQPDGDSIRFRADVASRWNGFKWVRRPKRKEPLVQLRFEGVDALEIHHNGYHQPRSFAIGALERLLELLGIEGAVYSISVRTIVTADDGKPGFIAASEIDAFNRPVCLVFPPDAPLTDGAELEAGELPIEQSVNYLMCRDGMVYPTFYTTTAPEIVQKIAAAAREAREARRGFWMIDRTSRFSFYDIRTIHEDVLILPKLFRRLTSFSERAASVSELISYLKEDRDFVRLADGSRSSLDELITVQGRLIGFRKRPEELFFEPKV